MTLTCNLCESSQLEPMYTLDTTSITSMSKQATKNQETRVWFCADCGHTMTEPLADIEGYYADHYNFLTGSETEDQLLKIVDGIKIFRSDFQAEMLSNAIDFKPGMRVLDYGCGKAETLRKLVGKHQIEPFVFDVSDNYRHFWHEFIPDTQQASHQLPVTWNATMDVVYSLFCLEHVAKPLDALASHRDLLKGGGRCYMIIPNVYTNAADLLVVDHVNHFAECSLRYALEKVGFDDITLEPSRQAGWLIASAKRRIGPPVPASLPPVAQVNTMRHAVSAIAKYWQIVTAKIARFRIDKPVAVYGAGFYGAYAVLHLDPSVQVECFIDQNIHLHNTLHLDRPVVAPANLPPHIKHVVVALNRAYARKVMMEMDVWKGRDITFEFLFQDDE